ncbi:MAG: PKD domain-containing protein, partial [Bacteroidota bacterium]
MKKLFSLVVLFSGIWFSSIAQVDPTCTQVAFTLSNGTYPTEVSYTVINSSGVSVATGTPTSTPSGWWCLPNDCYTVQMWDSFGDGWNGAVLNVLVMNGGSFSFTFSTGSASLGNFGVGVSDCGTPVLLGCTDPAAANYNANATSNDGSCIYEGCTDVAAINYNAQATTDDGSCQYCNGPSSVVSQLYICTFSNGNQVALTIVNSAGDTIFTSPSLNNVAIFYESLCLMEGECYTTIMSNSAGLTGWYNGYFWINNGQMQVIHTELASDLTTQSVQFSIDGTCGDIFGCTNPLAPNFNANATIDDGSCILISGCTDSTAVNFDPSAVIDNGTCFYGCDNGNLLTLDFNPGYFMNESSFSITDENGVLITEQVAANVSNAISTSFACVQDGCYVINMFDSFGDGWDGGSGGFLNVYSNGLLVDTYSLESGNFATASLGINANCGAPDSCFTNLNLLPDSLTSGNNTVFVEWSEDLTNVALVEWTFGDGVASNDTYPTYYYDSLGTYTLCVTVYFFDGCSATDCVTFTMNGDGSYGPGGIVNNGFW